MKHLLLSVLFACIASLTLAQPLTTSPIFGEQGFREYPVWSGSSAGYEGVMRDDGFLLVAGSGYWSTCNCFRLTLAMVDTTCGALDPAFGNNGVKDVMFEGRSTGHDFYIQDDGKIVGCGMTAPGNGFSGFKPAVYRLNADGTPDATFNGTGYNKVSFNAISSGNFWQAFPTSNGGILSVGASSTNINGGTYAWGVMRFLPDGTLDPSYSGDGIASLNLSALGLGCDYDIGTAVMLPDSSLVAIGLITSGGQQTIGLAKFLSDGTPDMTFGTNGLAVSTVGSVSDIGTAGMNAAVDVNGSILVSGTKDLPNGEFLMARFLPDGSLDSSFGTNGESVVAVASNALGRRMELLPDGSTLQYGSQNWNNGLPRIVKRLADGSLDTGFGNNGIAAPYGPLYKKVYGGMTLPSGRILAWGYQNEIGVFSFTSDPASEEFLDLGPDVVGCQGDSVLLDAGSIYETYVWDTQDSTQTIWASMGGDYAVTVTDAAECHDVDTVTVSFQAPPAVPVITSTTGVDLTTAASGNLQWYLDGVAIPGATGTDWTALQNGDYTVQVTDSAGCSSLSAVFTVDNVGMEELTLERITVHPNPSEGLFRVTVPTEAGTLEVVLLDALGRPCDAHWSSEGTLDARHLNAGSYLLVINDRGGHRAVRPLIIR